MTKEWQKTISVWIQISIYHQQDQRRAVGFSTPLISSLVHPSLFSPWIWRATMKVVICSPYSRRPFPQQPLSAGTRQELPACSSGPENIWRAQIIAICWKRPPWKVRERPELFLQHLKHQKLYLRPVPWGGGTKKCCRYGGRTRSSTAQSSALEQLPLRIMASILQSRSRVAVLSKIYSPNLFINAVKHFFFFLQ